MAALDRVRDALGAALASRGLSRADGVPLYSYPLDDASATTLASSVVAVLCSWSRLTKFEFEIAAAGFCLVGSRRVSENYSGGPWHWGLVTSDLPFPDRENQALLRDLVGSGMRWWNRDGSIVRLSGMGRFLMTLVVEGGLPLGVLRRESHSITRFLDALLQARERAPTLRLRAEAEHLKRILPPSLRGDAVLDLAVQLIDEVAHLRGELADAKANDVEVERRVAAQLQRGGFALQSGREEAARLVRHLVGKPSRERLERPTVAAHCETRLIIASEAEGRLAACVQRRVRLATAVTAQGLAAVLDVAPAEIEKLGGRFRLVAYAGGNGIQVGRAAWDEAGYRLDFLEHDGLLDPTRAIRIGAESAAMETPPADLAGGERLPPEVPWAFADEGGDYRFVGAGDASTHAKTVLVALPPESRADAAHATQFELAGTLRQRDPLQVRSLYRLAGALTVEAHGETFVLETSAPGENEGVVRFVGKRVYPAGFDGGVCWLGLPGLEELTDSGSFRPVPRERIQWRPFGGRWQYSGGECVGEVSVRVSDANGRVIFASRCVVLPPNTSFRWTDEGAGRGRLVIGGLGAVQASAAGESQGTVVEVSAGPGGVLDLTAVGDGNQRKLRLELVWATGRARIAVTNPVPVRGFRRGERVLRPWAIVTPEDLPLITAEMCCKAPASLYVTGESQPLVSLREAEARFWRLPLRNIQEYVEAMLAAQDRGARPEVRLTLEAAGTVPAAAGLVVRPYARTLCVEPDRPRRATTEETVAVAALEATDVWINEDQAAIAGAAGVATATEVEPGDPTAVRFKLIGPPIARVEIECRPLVEPDGAPVLAETIADEVASDAGVDSGAEDHPNARANSDRSAVWRFAFDGRQPGPWLATACVGDHPVAPTRLVVVPGDPDPNERVTLLEAIVNAPDAETRIGLWQVEAVEMARDPRHELWPVVEAMTGRCGQLPPGTFDALRAVASRPAAAAALVVRCPYRELALEHFESMPMLWALVPATAWHDAFQRWGNFYFQLLVGAGMDAVGAAERTREELLVAAKAIGQPEGLRATCAWALSQVDAKLRPASPWNTRLPARAASMLLQQGWQQAARNEPNRLRALPPRIEHAELRLALGGERSWLCHAPLLAAAVSAGRQQEAVDVAMLKLARAHDPRWFDRAFEWASAWLLGDAERP